MATNPVRLAIDDLPSHVATLKSELREGHVIELVSGDEVVAEMRAPVLQSAQISSPQDEERQRPPMPDFMARMKATWGDRVFDDSTKWIREDRDAGF